MRARLSRWFWLRLFHMAPRDIVDLHGHIETVDESVQWLKECVSQALALCEPVDGAPCSPQDVLDEEWSK